MRGSGSPEDRLYMVMRFGGDCVLDARHKRVRELGNWRSSSVSVCGKICFLPLFMHSIRKLLKIEPYFFRVGNTVQKKNLGTWYRCTPIYPFGQRVVSAGFGFGSKNRDSEHWEKTLFSRKLRLEKPLVFATLFSRQLRQHMPTRVAAGAVILLRKPLHWENRLEKHCFQKGSVSVPV